MCWLFNIAIRGLCRHIIDVTLTLIGNEYIINDHWYCEDLASCLLMLYCGKVESSLDHMFVYVLHKYIFRLSSVLLHFLSYPFSQYTMIIFWRFRKNRGWCWRKKLHCKEEDLRSCEEKGDEDSEKRGQWICVWETWVWPMGHLRPLPLITSSVSLHKIQN